MARRIALLKEIRRFARSEGLTLDITEGANHTKVHVGKRRTVIPRHTDINELTARSIRRQLGMEQ